MTENSENEKVATEAKNTSFSLNTFYGKKAGMTRIFHEDGTHIPVTVIKLIPNVVTQTKSQEKEGYNAYQIGYGVKRESLLNKPMKGHVKKSGSTENVTKFYEVKSDEIDSANVGKLLEIEENFSKDTYVDVTSTSKGKGFQGVIKRHNFSGGPAAHGSKFHRTTGSIGMSATPSRVHKNKKMPGQMGNKTKTVQNLMVVDVNKEEGYLLIKGSVPGHKNSFVKIQRATKK